MTSYILSKLLAPVNPLKNSTVFLKITTNSFSPCQFSNITFMSTSFIILFKAKKITLKSSKAPTKGILSGNISNGQTTYTKEAPTTALVYIGTLLSFKSLNIKATISGKNII